MELERAHDENRRLLDIVLAGRGGPVRDVPSSVPSEPIRPSGMSFAEAVKRVKQFERRQLDPSEPGEGEKVDVSEIEKTISSGGSGPDNRGFAV